MIIQPIGEGGYWNERKIVFDLYNIGDEAALASENWALYYIYYDPYDADNWGVLFYDFFSDYVAPGTFDCPPPDYACYFNFDIPSGSSFTTEVWGLSEIDRTYYMPDITGYYYLVLMADAYDDIPELDEANNFFYTSGQLPIYFDGGYADDQPEDPDKIAPQPDKTTLKKHDRQTAVHEGNLNAYTTAEIQAFVQAQKESGALDQKIQEYLQRGKAGPYTPK